TPPGDLQTARAAPSGRPHPAPRGRAPRPPGPGGPARAAVPQPAAGGRLPGPRTGRPRRRAAGGAPAPLAVPAPESPREADSERLARVLATRQPRVRFDGEPPDHRATAARLGVAGGDVVLARARAGLSQRELAHGLGVHRSLIAMAETDDRPL